MTEQSKLYPTEHDRAKIDDAHAIARRAGDRLAFLSEHKSMSAASSIEFDIMHRLLHALSDMLALCPDAPEAKSEPVAWIWHYRDNDRKSLRWRDDQRNLNDGDVPWKVTPLYTAPDVEGMRAAVIAMAEDGWLAHGPKGMSEAQEKLYDAYLIAKPEYAAIAALAKDVE